MRLNIHFSAALIFCLPLLHASAPANADPVSAEIQAGVQELMGKRQKLLNQLPDSLLAQQIADILSKAAAELTAYDAQLRPQNLPYNERIDKLRQRFREQMNPLYELKPTGGFNMVYGESYFTLEIWETGGSTDSRRAYILSGKLAQLFNMMSFFSEAARTDPDTFNRAFKMALRDFMKDGQNIAQRERHKGTKFASELLKRFSEIRDELTRLDEELRQQNAPHRKRVKELRELYLKWMKRFNHFGPVYEGGSEDDIEFFPQGPSSSFRISSVRRFSGGTSKSTSEGPIAGLLDDTLLVFETRFDDIVYYLGALMLFAVAVLAFFLVGSSRRNRRQSA